MRPPPTRTIAQLCSPPQHAVRDRKRAGPRRRRHRARRLGPVSRRYPRRERSTAASRLLGSATYYALGLHGRCAEVLARPSPRMRSTRRCTIMRAARRWPGAATPPRCAPRRRRSRRSARGTEAPALGPRGAPLAEIFQRVLEGRAAMLAGDHRARRGRLSRGDEPPARRRFRLRSAALLVFGAAQPRRRRARRAAMRAAPATSCAPRSGAGPTTRSRSTLCRWPSGASAAAPRPIASLATRPRRLGGRRDRGAAVADLTEPFHADSAGARV